MFKELIAAGEALIQRLEANMIQPRRRLSAADSDDMVSFKELESWKKSASDAIGRILGSDPQLRFDSIWGLFDEEWNRARGPTPKGQQTLKFLVDYLGRLEARINPAVFDRAFDWSAPPDPSDIPEIVEIEAKRWEFHRALLEDAQRKRIGTLDPLATAQRISLHPFHAREFFISLAASGHLNREALTPEWRTLADEVDAGQPAPPLIQSEPLSVFLCHASEDKAQVRSLRAKIEKWGHDPWLDEEKLLPGQDWDREIRRACRSARTWSSFASQTAPRSADTFKKKLEGRWTSLMSRPKVLFT